MISDRGEVALRLFGYETDRGEESELWKNPWYFSRPGGQAGSMLDEAFNEWFGKHRPFVEADVKNTRWAKLGSHGIAMDATLLEDGTVHERALMSGGNSWSGTWNTEGGVLTISIGPYSLAVIAAKDGLHSGVEFKDGEPKYQVYFRLIQIR